MRVARSVPELRAARGELIRESGRIGLVPTMGALHAGHVALVEAARAGGGAVAVSIFVNPTQFAAGEDLDAYPRDEAGDLELLRRAGCDLVWLPTVDAMYPPGDATLVEVGGPALGWEGEHRPGHFRGVATVCTKLFGQVGPDLAYFGEKDWQQLLVVRRVVADLSLPLGIVGVPTVREPDGLAMSSRNRRLGGGERAVAALVPAALRRCAGRLAAGDGAALRLAAAELTEGGLRLDYLALVDGGTLAPIPAPRPGARLIVAARVGSVRLLDNMPVPPPAP